MSLSISQALPRKWGKINSGAVLRSAVRLNPLSWLPRPSARFHIAIGLSSLLASVVLLAIFLGVVPDRKTQQLKSRVVLSEAVATLGSILLRDGNVSGLRYSLEFVVEQNDDIHAIEMQRGAGSVSFRSTRDRLPSDKSPEEFLTDDVQVPLLQRGRHWGQLIFRFVSSDNLPWYRRFRESPLFLMAFIGFVSFPLFYLFLGKMLKELNPSTAVPSRVRSALDTIAEALLVLDTRGNVVLANAAFAELNGKSPDALLGQAADSLPWSSDGQSVTPVWEDSLIRAVATRHDKIGFLDATGQLRTFIVNCSPVFAADDEVGGVLISMDDVTQLEEQEVLLRESMKSAEAANRAKSTFLSNMSHEIRTPMTAILGFTEVMKRNTGTSESERQSYLNTISNSGQHLLELINDVLDLSKVESGAMEIESLTCNCASIAHDVVRVLQTKADEKAISLSMEIVTDFPDRIIADPSRLRQVITNLVGNAIKFTDSGSVKVQLSFMQGQESGSAHVGIGVVDTGIGMSEQQQMQIFEAFTQANASISRRYGGTGLGLSISRQLAEAMNGTLTVSSEEGVGSTFYLKLPVAHDEFKLLTPAAIEESLQSVVVETHPAWELPESRILVVDDGAENRQLMSVILRNLKLTVAVAENGKQGLDATIAALQSEPFDLIFMDIQMPVMDGFEAVSAMRDAGVNIPVVALTANVMKGFEADILASGFSHYMVKPLDIDQLGDLLAQELGGTRVQRPVDDTPSAGQPSKAVSDMDTRSGIDQVHSTLPLHIPDFYDVVEQFIQRVQQELLTLEVAVQEADYESVARIAHWLRGSGGNVGYDGFGPLCNALESGARTASAQLDHDFACLASYTRQVLAGWHATPRPQAASK